MIFNTRIFICLPLKFMNIKKLLSASRLELCNIENYRKNTVSHESQ